MSNNIRMHLGASLQLGQHLEWLSEATNSPSQGLPVVMVLNLDGKADIMTI